MQLVLQLNNASLYKYSVGRALPINLQYTILAKSFQGILCLCHEEQEQQEHVGEMK